MFSIKEERSKCRELLTYKHRHENFPLMCNPKSKRNWKVITFFFQLFSFRLVIPKIFPIGIIVVPTLWETLIDTSGLPPPPHPFHRCEKCGPSKRRNLVEAQRESVVEPWSTQCLLPTLQHASLEGVVLKDKQDEQKQALNHQDFCLEESTAALSNLWFCF